MLTPALRVLSDRGVWRRRDLEAAVCDHLGLTDAQRAEVLSSGQLRTQNWIGWALSGLVRADRRSARTGASNRHGKMKIAHR
ncbi:winged helix-turn-helix domain-containing protein [Nocardia fluminea]|uniref:winged helix-turn-helix domain-containing protein n=1 Tax=Nocardia fluminea TaxID=134984 RepID=UPI0033EFE4CC